MSQDDLQKKIEEAKKAAKKKEEKSTAQNDSNSTGNSSGSTSNNAQNTTSSEDSAINNLKQELEQMTELAKRTMADLQNLRRRHEEERRILITTGNTELITDLLPILDNLERAAKHVPEGANEWFKGIEISLTQLHQTLANFGLKPIECVNQDFNPDLHEAIAQDIGEENKIIEELEKGYMLGERVIRHSKVKVGNGKTNA